MQKISLPREAVQMITVCASMANDSIKYYLPISSSRSFLKLLLKLFYEYSIIFCDRSDVL